MEKTITTSSAEETVQLAEKIGTQLRGGECIEFVSDLGGGKTTFTAGLAKGLGSEQVVSSPTFTIGKQYRAGDKTIYHFDFYRLQDPGLVQEELAEATENPQSIIVVEWGETVKHVLPKDRLHIDIQKVADDFEQRQLCFRYTESLEYLFEGVDV